MFLRRCGNGKTSFAPSALASVLIDLNFLIK